MHWQSRSVPLGRRKAHPGLPVSCDTVQAQVGSFVGSNVCALRP